MLSATLKERTLAEHRETEKQVPFFKENFNLVEYQKLLQKLLRYFESYEAALEPWRQLGIPHFQVRSSKAQNIRHDLISLGVVPPQSPRQQFKFNTKAEVLGAMYVIEGSSLGGQIIARYLKSIGIPETAIRFYLGYAEKTKEYWQEFKNYLDEHSEVSNEFSETCVRKAKQTFFEFGEQLKN